MTRRLFIPRAYQRPMVSHMFEHARGALFAGMGMGKTCSALTAIDGEFLAGVESKPALVLAPLRVAQNTWPDEATKWEHLHNIEVRPIVGTVNERKLALRDILKGRANVATINYENLPWLIEEYLNRGAAWPFGRVIADESTKLKSFRLRQGGKRAQAIARVAHSQVKRWTNLTGTPAPNGLADLWGQTWYLDAGLRLGRTFTAFEQRWFRPSWDGYGITPLETAQQQIEDKLRDICLSLDPADHFDLKVPIESTVRVDLPKKARQQYDEMERRLFMEEAAGMPVLVAYHFNSTKERLLKNFKRGRLLDKNPQTIRDWNAGKIPILFAHPASCGHGLNLQDGGNIVVFVDHDWNLENFQQIIERIGPVRQMQAGHDRPVFIYYIVATDTVDEIVMARRTSKREVQDLLLENLKQRRIFL